MLHPIDEADRSRKGFSLPRWILAGAIPLALALGFLSGVAIGYFGTPPSPSPAAEPGADATKPDDPASAGPSGTKTPTNKPEAWSGLLLPPVADEPVTALVGGRWFVQPPEIKTASTFAEAQSLLADQFSEFRSGGLVRFRVEYREAHDANRNRVLVGVVKVTEYPAWLQAMQDNRSEVVKWLETAAERVKPAAKKERFNLVWAVWEKVDQSPYGFSSLEVTPLHGQYLVNRPLAAVTDFERIIVSMAPGMGPVTNADSPWAVYGPVLKFDPDDLYRPPGTSRTRGLHP